MAVEPSRGVEIIQRSLVWFGQTEQAAAAVQQPCELARLTFDDQQPIVDGDVGRVALGQAECMCFGDDGRVPWMNRVRARSPNAGNLPADHGLCLSLLGHTGSSFCGVALGARRRARAHAGRSRPASRRLALALTGRRTIKAHARTVYRCVIGVTPVLPVQRRGGPPVFWRICAPHQRGFVPVKGAQRRREPIENP